MKILGLICSVVLLCAASYFVGQAHRSRKTASAHERYVFQLQRLTHAFRAIQLLDEGDPVQLRKESEADLFYSLDGIAPVVNDLDEGSSDYITLWQVLDIFEGYLKKHPLKHKNTDDLLCLISGLRDAAGRSTPHSTRVQSDAASE